MITINTNVNNLKLQRNLNTVNFNMQTATERMSTGYRINSAQDDAAGLMISKALTVQSNGLNVANQNAQMATNVLSVADGALSQVSDLTMRIRDLALQAANGGYSNTERMALENEAFSLTNSIKQLVEGTKFNDCKVLGTSNAMTSGVRISTAKELKEALTSTEALNNTNYKIILTGDINLNDLGFDANGSNWAAISGTFSGTLDGNGYSIKNLTMNSSASSANLGLFRNMDGATIQNVKLENVNIKATGSSSYVGALAVNAYNSNISNVSVSGIVNSTNCAGGVFYSLQNSNVSNSSSSADVSTTIPSGGGSPYVGGFAATVSNSTIKNSFSTGAVKSQSGNGSYSDSYAGGFVGVVYNSTMINCYSNSSVSNINNYVASNYWAYAGGFAGYADSGNKIINSYATGNISTSGSNINQKAGGFIGVFNSSEMTNCYATGDVTSKNSIGGLVGYTSYSTISNCIAKGNIYNISGANSSSTFGGLVGYTDYGTISNSYSTGQNNTTIGYRGGFIGQTSNTVVKSYAFATQSTSGVNTTTGLGTGSTGSGSILQSSGQVDSWFKNASNISFINSGSTNPLYNNQWDLSTITTNGIPTLKKLETQEKAIRVSNAKELKEALINVDALNNKDFKIILTNDINLNDLGFDANGSNWSAIGDNGSAFMGTFDGNGYTIKNLTMNKNANYQGLFGYVDGATIKNVNLENVNVQNSGSYHTGALVGYAIGSKIENCSVSGSVKGVNYTGLLVGNTDYNYENNIQSNIISCYATGSVTGTSNVGGLVGSNNSSAIKNSFSNATVTGTSNVGGLAGYNNNDYGGTVSNCYATGGATGTNNVGGLVGYGGYGSHITSCYATGSVTGTNNVGGFLGYGEYYNTIKNCYSSGDIFSTTGANGTSSFGGFLGYGEYCNTITNCYSSGQNNATIGYRGGFLGYNNYNEWDQNYYANNNFIVQTGGFGAIGYGPDDEGITEQTSAYFTNTLKETTLNNPGLWDFKGSSPKLKWQSAMVNPLTFQIGTDGSSLSQITINTSFNISELNFSFMTEESSREAIEACDSILKQINRKRAEIGANVNIIGSIVDGNTITNENLLSSKSRIQDADIAKESANMVKNQILQNATTALLAQSQNINGNLVLSLLMGIK